MGFFSIDPRILPELDLFGRKKSDKNQAPPSLDKGPTAEDIAVAQNAVADPSQGKALLGQPGALMILQQSMGASFVLDIIHGKETPGADGAGEDPDADMSEASDKADEKEEEKAAKEIEETEKTTKDAAQGASQEVASQSEGPAETPEPESTEQGPEPESEGGQGAELGGAMGGAMGGPMGAALGAAAGGVLDKLHLRKKKKKAPKAQKEGDAKGTPPAEAAAGAPGSEGTEPVEPPPGADAGPTSPEALDKGEGESEEEKKVAKEAEGAGAGGAGGAGPQLAGDKKAEGGEKGGGEKGGAKEASLEGGPGGGIQALPPAPAPEEPVIDPGPGGTLDGYMAANPDMTHADQLEQIGFSNDRIARDERTLASNIPKAPDKGTLKGILTGDWAAMQKGLTGNRWRGQDKVMAFTTDLNTIIGFVSGIASKVGLAATIGGAILTFFLPPVGAFLLTVGRVANAVSLVCAGLKGVISMVQMIYAAVKAAKEKDPHKRMEYLQGAKTAVQGLVMSGLEVVMSKLGGKAKVGGSRVGSAMKAGWKEAGLKGALKSGGKELLKAGKDGLSGALKGAGGAIKNIPKALKSMGGTIKAGFGALKQQGLKGTLKSAGKAGIAGLKKGVKPITDAAKGFKDLKTQFSNFKELRQTHGYWGAVKQSNFTQATLNAQGWKNKVKEGFKDLTDSQRGGYASKLHTFMNGPADKPKEPKPGDDPALNSDDAVTRTLAADKKKMADMQAALDSGKREDMIDQLNGGDATKTAAGEHSQYADADLRVMLSQKHTAALRAQNLMMPSGGMGVMNMGSTALKVGQSAMHEDGGMMSAAMTGIGSLGSGGALMSEGAGMLSDFKTHGDLFPKYLQGVADKNTATWKAEASKLQKESIAERKTQGKVKLVLAGVTPLIAQHAAELQQAAQTPSGGGAAMAAGAAAGAVVGAASAKSEPPPPAPEEGTLVPTDISGYAESERKRLGTLKTQVEAHVETSEQGATEAKDQLSDLAKIALKLDTHKAAAKEQSAEAKKDVGDIAKAKQDIESGQAGVNEGKGKAEGAQGEADGKLAEGKAVDTKPDEGAKRKKEEERAREKEQEWKDEYNRAGWVKKKYMRAKKWLFSFTKLLAAAAKWIWKKLIAPAIKAVKAAMAKVMGFITDMIFSGVMKVVSLFLSEEDKKNLNETLDKMKQAEKAAQQAQDLESSQKEASVKLSKTDKKAKEELDRNNANVATGKALLENIEGNLTALDGLEAENGAARESFASQYGPYFDWVARREQEGEGGGAGGAIAAVAAGAGAAALTEQGAEGEGDEEADIPMPEAVGEGISKAADIIEKESDGAHETVKTTAQGYRDKLRKKAGDVFDANKKDFKQKGLNYLQSKIPYGLGIQLMPSTLASYTDEEYKRCEQISNNADEAYERLVGEHRATEDARKGRLKGIKVDAAGLSSMSGIDSISLAKALVKKLERETGGVTEDQNAAVEAALETMANAANKSI